MASVSPIAPSAAVSMTFTPSPWTAAKKPNSPIYPVWMMAPSIPRWQTHLVQLHAQRADASLAHGSGWLQPDAHGQGRCQLLVPARFTRWQMGRLYCLSQRRCGRGRSSANKNVELRLIPADGGESKTIVSLFGGQGTINVNSGLPIIAPSHSSPIGSSR